jgi:hypothetical protein
MKTILFLTILSFSSFTEANSIKSSVKDLNEFLNKPEPVVECKTVAKGDVENSEVKIMYPCSVWEDRKAVLDEITDKKKVYKSIDGKFLTDDEVKALTPEQKKAAEKKEMLEKSDIVFSKLSPLIDKNGDGKNDVVIRSRVNYTTGEKDYTIKLRPMDPTDLNMKGLNKKLIKCERDVASVTNDGSLKPQDDLIADRGTISCSQTIDNVTASSEDSENFLSANGLKFEKAEPYNSIKSEKRSLKATDLGFASDYMGVDDEGKEIKLKISLEKWQVPGLSYPQGCFLELSAKSPVGKMNQVASDLKQKFESKLGVIFDNSIVQGNKTGQALKLMDK